MMNAGVRPKHLLAHAACDGFDAAARTDRARPFATASEFAGSGVARDGGPTSAAARLLVLAPQFVERLRLPFPERQLAVIADLVAIARGELRVEDRIGVGVSEAEFVRARNRIYQAHTRMRSHLREAIVYFGRTGRISPAETAELLAFVLHVLHRRPRRAPVAA